MLQQKVRRGSEGPEFTVSDFIATLNYHSHVEADDYGHSLTPPRQICRAWCRAVPRLVVRSVLRGSGGAFRRHASAGEKDGSDPISTRRHFAERLDGTGKM